MRYSKTDARKKQMIQRRDDRRAVREKQSAPAFDRRFAVRIAGRIESTFPFLVTGRGTVRISAEGTEDAWWREAV